eukprot:337038-Chlamydomonas_euryale.AAC.6
MMCGWAQNLLQSKTAASPQQPKNIANQSPFWPPMPLPLSQALTLRPDVTFHIAKPIPTLVNRAPPAFAGLDAAAAAIVVRVVRSVANAKRSVVVTIHQPSAPPSGPQLAGEGAGALLRYRLRGLDDRGGCPSHPAALATP